MHALNLFFACVCIAANTVLLIVLPPRLSIPKRLLLLGGLLAALFCWMWVYAKWLNPFVPAASAAPWKDLHLRGSLAVFILLFINLFAAVCIPALVRGLAKFHTTCNRSQIHKKPLQLFLNNTDKVELAYRLFFLLGSVPIFYGVWTDPKVIQ